MGSFPDDVLGICKNKRNSKEGEREVGKNKSRLRKRGIVRIELFLFPNGVPSNSVCEVLFTQRKICRKVRVVRASSGECGKERGLGMKG